MSVRRILRGATSTTPPEVPFFAGTSVTTSGRIRRRGRAARTTWTLARDRLRPYDADSTECSTAVPTPVLFVSTPAPFVSTPLPFASTPLPFASTPLPLPLP